VATVSTDWYRIGDGYLGLQSEHVEFRKRFQRLFAGCHARAAGDETLPRVLCAVRTDATRDACVVRFDDPEPLDMRDFAKELFGDRGDVVLEVAGDALIVSNAQSWEWLIGNLAVHRLLRLQRDLVVFHAASAGIDGRGVLLVGPKGSGKTTMSLTLASRGHAFLGDEMAALRLPSVELVPVRRAVSIRPGPQSARVNAALHGSGHVGEPFPDGTLRVRTSIDDLFPGNAAGPVPLSIIAFLRERQAIPRLARLRPEREHLRLLNPLRSSLWHMRPAARAIRLLGILPKARCFWLDAGEPDATADLLEQAVDGEWD
jgi:hypothetical protein